MRLSVSAAQPRLPLLPWKQDSYFEWSITAISSDAIFLFMPIVCNPRFYPHQTAIFLSQLLLLISGDSTFAISDFSSPDDIYISCVSTLMILTSCTCASKSKDKQMSIRMDPATQQLTVFVNITWEQSFFFFLNCPAFITRHVRQHPLLWISDVLDSHLLPGGGRVC